MSALTTIDIIHICCSWTWASTLRRLRRFQWSNSQLVARLQDIAVTNFMYGHVMCLRFSNNCGVVPWKWLGIRSNLKIGEAGSEHKMNHVSIRWEHEEWMKCKIRDWVLVMKPVREFPAKVCRVLFHDCPGTRWVYYTLLISFLDGCNSWSKSLVLRGNFPRQYRGYEAYTHWLWVWRGILGHSLHPSFLVGGTHKSLGLLWIQFARFGHFSRSNFDYLIVRLTTWINIEY